MKQDFFKKSGFSVIELLIVIAITLSISAVTYFSYSAFSGYQTLEKQTDVAHSMIEKARLQALNSKDFSEFGIKFASSSVTLFQGVVYSPSATSNQMYSLTSRIQISSISLTGNVSEMYFNNVTGEPSATGTITFMLNNATSTKVITIFGTGLSEVN
jgi:prepilin-type N-terminal cleavage/methylation domain-containing protein